MPEEIRITDLRAPQYDQAQLAALQFGETLRVEFSLEAVLGEACEQTGLSDFGADDFRERLALLLDEWGSDTGLSGLGRYSLHRKLVLYARNRLLIEDLLRRHPEILTLNIDRPIIVAGLPRSGTTHLLNLLAADQRFCSLPLWESYEPVPLPGEAALADGTDPRYQRCAEQWQAMQQMVPHLAAMHPMAPDHIHEELELMGPDFASYNFEWLSMSPRWRDHYYASDQTPHYRYMKKVLQILQWLHSDSADRAGVAPRWVLKCPQHLEQLPVLVEQFPDATIVMTHRDPVAVIQSAVTMLAYGQRMNRKQVETAQLIAYWSDRIEHLLRACVADRPMLSPVRSIDVLFHEFMADDIGIIENIYDLAGVGLGSDARGQLHAYLKSHPRGKEGRVRYDLESDFGVHPDHLHARFGFYFDRFPVIAETAVAGQERV